MKETDNEKFQERSYNDCFFCGGAVEERLITREYRWKDHLFIVENVPVGVCIQCGEKVIKPEVAKAVDQILQEKRNPAKIIQVPVYEYALEAA